MSTTALDSSTDPGLRAAEQAHHRQMRRLAWRRRLLPLAGIATFLGLWAFIVWFFEVPRFVAPSPQLVAATLIEKHEMLLRNLLPTAMQAIAGFILGNLAAIVIATVFVHRKAAEEAFFPVVVLINTIPVVAKAPILV
ncbi:MAG: hypothetical protein RLZZ187_2868, partial [Pseudomonadota bacterium]